MNSGAPSSHPMTRDEFAAFVTDATAGKPHVSRETLARLDLYAEALRAWQPRINLVSNKSLDDLWRRHFLDSAQLAKWITPEMRVLDLGSGAGFPGLVLSIITGANVVLAESDARKCAFLREVRRLTEANAEIAEGRIEDLDAGPFDVVTARALAPLSALLDHAAGRVKPDGFCLFLKGARVDDELTDARENWKMEMEPHPSLSDPDGVVLRIRNLSRV